MRGLRALPALLVALALAACATAPRGAPEDAISVVTLNIYHDKADWPKRLPLVVDGLQALRPDVIALQEVLQHDTLPNQARTIADALGYDVHFISVDPADRARRYGNAILTPHPILARGGCRLEPVSDGRTLAHARIAIDGTVVDVFATHLHHEQHGSAMRRQQADGVLAAVDATRDPALPVLLLGDFNASVDDAGLSPLRTRFADAYGVRHGAGAGPPAHATLNPAYFAATARIDHVLVERGRFDVIDADIVFDTPAPDGAWASDHFGVFAAVRVSAGDGDRRRTARAGNTPGDAAAACRRAGLPSL